MCYNIKYKNSNQKGAMNMVIENLKENIISNEDVLKILKYSHFNPTKEKLSKLTENYHKNEDVFPSDTSSEFRSYIAFKIKYAIV